MTVHLNANWVSFSKAEWKIFSFRLKLGLEKMEISYRVYWCFINNLNYTAYTIYR
jgi:hypothetical protein